MSALSQKHLLGIKYLKNADVESIFNTTTEFKKVLQRKIKKVPSLRGETISNIFFENSTRTKLSFELAQKRLSADIINFSHTNSSVKKGESLLDTVTNILAMKVEMIVWRHWQVGSANFIAQHTKTTVINAGDGTNEHPTQALLDAYSLHEKFGSLKGLNVLILGDILHSRVAMSNIYCLKMLGANIKLCCPKTLLPKHITELGVSYEEDLNKALLWADAVNVLRIQLERQNQAYFPSREEYIQHWSLTNQKLNRSKKNMVILHPGPINRGLEIQSTVADAENSLILNQVENGVAVRMAIMYLLSKQA